MEKRNRLAIMKIKDTDGRWLEDPTAIQQHALDFFQQLFTAEPVDPKDVAHASDKFLDYVPCSITPANNQQLLQPLVPDEVREAVFQLDPDSSPGSDGFTGKIFQSFWSVVSDDMLNAVQEFLVGVPIPKIISSTLMVLLPKKQSPTTFADFRPISLCNFVNKVFTRVLCNRLKDLLPSLISEEQSAFIHGRDISDNVLLAREMLQHLDRKIRGNNVMFSLDMMKAFDHVSWKFLEQLLSKFGFHGRFIQPIMNNLKASYFSVLINGASAGFFPSTRGLKQGDPLSPILFIMVVESLSRGLKSMIDTGVLATYSLPRNAPTLSHLCFADDLVIYTRAMRGSVRSLFAFLQEYELASGRLVNWHKSSFLISRHSSRRQVR